MEPVSTPAQASTQISKSWREGTPANEGMFLFGNLQADGRITGERLGTVTLRPNGKTVTYIGDNDAPTTDFTGIAHFGPIPDPQRSLKAVARFAQVRVAG